MKNLTQAKIDKYSISSWYKDFQKFTIPTIMIPLSRDFVEYLLSDSIFIPRDTERNANDSQRDANRNSSVDFRDESFESESESWSDSDTTECECGTEGPSFPELDGQIRAAIAELGRLSQLLIFNVFS